MDTLGLSQNLPLATVSPFDVDSASGEDVSDVRVLKSIVSTENLLEDHSSSDENKPTHPMRKRPSRFYMTSNDNSQEYADRQAFSLDKPDSRGHKITNRSRPLSSLELRRVEHKEKKVVESSLLPNKDTIKLEGDENKSKEYTKTAENDNSSKRIELLRLTSRSDLDKPPTKPVLGPAGFTDTLAYHADRFLKGCTNREKTRREQSN